MLCLFGRARYFFIKQRDCLPVIVFGYVPKIGTDPVENGAIIIVAKTTLNKIWPNIRDQNANVYQTRLLIIFRICLLWKFFEFFSSKSQNMKGRARRRRARRARGNGVAAAGLARGFRDACFWGWLEGVSRCHSRNECAAWISVLVEACLLEFFSQRWFRGWPFACSCGGDLVPDWLANDLKAKW